VDIRGFELWLHAVGYRPDTVVRAVRIAHMYLAHCNGNSPVLSASVVSFLAHKASEVKRVTQLNYWKDLNLFFRFAVSEGLADENPLTHIPKPRPSLYEREKDTRFLPYADQEFHQLLEACPRWNWIGLRDIAILWMLWDTPLRVSELSHLTTEDMDWKALEVSVRDGKGGVQYEGLLSDKGALNLDRYLRARPKETTALFCDRHGSEPLSRHGFDQLLRRLGKRASLKKPCAPHYFRHAWRIRMRLLGLDDAAISALMGHRTVVVTHGYARHAVRVMAKAQLRKALG
jgi:integrase/recombinase XerD